MLFALHRGLPAGGALVCAKPDVVPLASGTLRQDVVMMFTQKKELMCCAAVIAELDTPQSTIEHTLSAATLD